MAEDLLMGGAGDDRLEGGDGVDTLEGGAGDDFFVPNGPGARIADEDFEAGAELAIDDRLLGFGRARVDVRDLTDEVGLDLLHDGVAGWSARTGTLSIDQDGDGTRDPAIPLGPDVRLTFDDILLI